MTLRTFFMALALLMTTSVAFATGNGFSTTDSSDSFYGGTTTGGTTNGGTTNGGTNGGTTNGGTTGGGEIGCVRTQGYWGNSPAGQARLIALLGGGTMNLGNVAYNAEQLDNILDEPAAGNALISLAHQLIAAKLNVLNGADDSEIDEDIALADSLIGTRVVPPVGNDSVAPNTVLGQQMLQVKDRLDAYNMGNLNVPSCN